MKKGLLAVLILTLTLCVVGCGKKEDKENFSEQGVTTDITEGGEETVTGSGSITINGTTFTLPCPLQDVINAVPNVNTRQEDLNEVLEPGESCFHSMFDFNNTQLCAMNLSDTALPVSDCYIVGASTGPSLTSASYCIVYPAGIEYDKEFDKQKVYEVLGEPSRVSENDGSLKYTHYQFKYSIDNQGEYQLSVSVLEDGKVGNIFFTMWPITATTEN